MRQRPGNEARGTSHARGTYHALVHLLLHVSDFVPAVLQQGPLLLEEGGGAAPRLAHQPPQLLPLDTHQPPGLEGGGRGGSTGTGFHSTPFLEIYMYMELKNDFSIGSRSL